MKIRPMILAKSPLAKIVAPLASKKISSVKKLKSFNILTELVILVSDFSQEKKPS